MEILIEEKYPHYHKDKSIKEFKELLDSNYWDYVPSQTQISILQLLLDHHFSESVDH